MFDVMFMSGKPGTHHARKVTALSCAILTRSQVDDPPGCYIFNREQKRVNDVLNM